MSNLKENLQIKKINNRDKIYCNATYASELYDIYNNNISVDINKYFSKDLDVDKVMKATVMSMDLNKIQLSLPCGLSVYSDLKKKNYQKNGFMIMLN